MKTYLTIVLILLIPAQAMACIEYDKMSKKYFIEYDINKDGYVDAQEWDNADSYFFGLLKDDRYYGKFEEYLKKYNKDADNKLSKEEFYPIFYTKGISIKRDCM